MSSSGSQQLAVPSWRSLLTGRWAISWQAWLLIALLMQWPYYARNSAFSQLPAVWVITIGILRVIAAGLVLLAADRTYLRRRSSEPAKLWIVVATWLAAGAAAAAAQWLFFGILGESGITPLRWVTSAITFALRSALCAYYLGLRDYWVGSVTALEASMQRLAQREASFRADLEHARARVRTIVVDEVLPHIRRLQAELGDHGGPSTPERLAHLSGLAASHSKAVVREASHRVSELDAETTLSTALNRRAAEGTRPPLPRRPLLISLRWSALVFAVTLAPFALTGPPEDPALPILLALATLVAILAVGAWIQDRVGGWTSTSLWSVSWMAGMAGGGIAGLVAVDLIPERLAHPVSLAALVVLVFLLATLGAAMDRHLRSITEHASALARVVDDITHINNTLQEEIATENRRVALLLHGPVQGRLAAVALLLRLDGEAGRGGHPGDDTLARCRAILHPVVDDLTRVMDGTFEDGALEDRLTKLAERWRGLADVTPSWTPDALAAVADSQSLRMWVFDIVEEGINNSVAHGDARNVEVNVSRDDDWLTVSVRDDGSGCGESTSPGLGLSAIGRSPARLTLTAVPTGGSQLVVRLPLTA